MTQPTSPTPALRLFAWMVECLRTALRPYLPLATPMGQLAIFTHNYLNRSLCRFESLFTRWRNGTLKPLRPRAPGPARPRAARPAAIRLPRGKTWLIRAVQKTAIGQFQLMTLLDDPEIKEFLRAVPRAGRILRPLCTALGVDPPTPLRRPPRPRRPRPPKPPPAPARIRPPPPPWLDTRPPRATRKRA